MSSGMARTTIRYILTAVDFLHMEAGIIHTNWVFPFEMIPAQSELNLERMTRSPAKNILLGIDQESILAKCEAAEFEVLVPRKMLENCTIYLSRPLPHSL